MIFAIRGEGLALASYMTFKQHNLQLVATPHPDSVCGPLGSVLGGTDLSVEYSVNNYCPPHAHYCVCAHSY